MERFSNISMAVVRRLPKYHRYLKDLIKKDVKRVSSQELSNITGFTASQIRQDLNCFGGFGQQGYGYNVEELNEEIGRIMGIDIKYKSIIVGAGNLGQAIANYGFFEKNGLKIQAMFDVSTELIGKEFNDIKVRDAQGMVDYIVKNNITIVILCIPKKNAQKTSELLEGTGVKAIWNFTPTDLKVKCDIIVENVHLSDSLFTLYYLLKEKEEGKSSLSKS